MRRDVMRVTDKDGDVWITNDDWYKTQPGYTVEENPTLDAIEIATWCDAEAENANYHGLVGTHEWLAELLVKEAGDSVALTVMTEIMKRGGLHEMY